MDKVVVSLGGSVIVPDDDDDVFLKRFSEMISTLCDAIRYTWCAERQGTPAYYIKVGRS
jgi:hypothetical protein